MEARVDPNNSWYLLMRLVDMNPDGEVVSTINIISFKTKSEAQAYIGAFKRSTKNMSGFKASYLIINKNAFERIK